MTLLILSRPHAPEKDWVRVKRNASAVRLPRENLEIIVSRKRA